VRSLLTDIEAKPASPNRILLDPSDEGWRGTIYTPNEEITVEAPTFREAVVAAIATEKALTASHTPSVDGPKRGDTMIKNLIRICSLTFLGVLLFAPHVLAQGAVEEKTEKTTTTTTTTTTSGTVSQFSPDGIVIRTTTSSAPVTYSSTKTTTYVDENGKPVAVETVKSGVPVTIYYSRDGDKMVATKVVVKKTTTGSRP
jgi:hypothetical protein